MKIFKNNRCLGLNKVLLELLPFDPLWYQMHFLLSWNKKRKAAASTIYMEVKVFLEQKLLKSNEKEEKVLSP